MSERRERNLVIIVNFVYTGPFIYYLVSAISCRYIQQLVEIFRKNAHEMDLLRMLTRVNESVASENQTNKDGYHQIPSFTSQLRKDLYLCPLNGPLKTIASD